MLLLKWGADLNVFRVRINKSRRGPKVSFYFVCMAQKTYLEAEFLNIDKWTDEADRLLNELYLTPPLAGSEKG